MGAKDDITLRELVRQQMTDSSAQHTAVLLKLKEMETHAIYTKEKVDTHEKDISDIKAQNNTQKGIMWGLGITNGATLLHSLKQLLGI